MTPLCRKHHMQACCIFKLAHLSIKKSELIDVLCNFNFRTCSAEYLESIFPQKFRGKKYSIQTTRRQLLRYGMWMFCFWIWLDISGIEHLISFYLWEWKRQICSANKEIRRVIYKTPRDPCKKVYRHGHPSPESYKNMLLSLRNLVKMSYSWEQHLDKLS